MSLIEKAFILHTDNKQSRSYAWETAQSCEAHNVPYEYLLGHEDLSLEGMQRMYGWTVAPGRYRVDWHKEFMCTLGHVIFWQKVIDENKTCAILEHDAIVLADLTKIDVDDDILVYLGYRVDKRDDYEFPENPQYEQFYISNEVRFEGTHGYAITPKMAKRLLDFYNYVMPMPIDGMLCVHNLANIDRSIVIPTPIVAEVRGKSQTMVHGNPARYNTIPPEEYWANIKDRSKYTTQEITPGELRIVF